ncbi:MAG: heavy metal translocating P-type ATPase [Christensenellales bacterium]
MRQRFKVFGMSCAACSAGVERAVGRLKGVNKVEVSLVAKSMLCDFDETTVSEKQIVEAVKKAGFKAYPEKASEAAQTAVAGRGNAAVADSDGFTPMKTRLIVSLIFLVLLMYVSMGHMIGLPVPSFMHGVNNGVSFAFVQFLLVLPILYVNRKFFVNGFKALWHRVPNMDSLVAVGSSAAVLYGIFAIFMIAYGIGNGDTELAEKYLSGLYFESGGMILTLVTVGKLLEERSKNKTYSAIQKLVDLAPKTAVVIRDGVETEIPVEKIVVGEVILLKPGSSVPVDGEVVEGGGTVDESALTGESMPVEKAAGDRLISASIVKSGAFKLKAQRVGEDTTLSQIVELVRNAASSKAPIGRLADKVSGIFVPVVMGIALVAAVVWLACGATFEFALNAAISVLVISCPCALGLATPLAIMVSTGKCASKGILIKSAEALEQLHDVNTVVLDKTGTVTEGKPSVTDVVPSEYVSESELASLAAALEKNSQHPLSVAVTEYAASNSIEFAAAEDFKNLDGLGVSAIVNGQTAYAGNEKLMSENKIDVSSLSSCAKELAGKGKTVMYFACGGKFYGLIAVADKVKPTSKEAVQALKKSGIEVIMLTGDNAVTAAAIKNEVGIDRVEAEVMPADKQRIVSELKNAGKKVVMVGDGINDSPALMQADVGIAIGSGTDIAIESADVVLMKNDLTDVSRAINYSKRTIRNIKQNLFWAFFYNALGIPLAAGALYPLWQITLSPMIGALAMSLSSLFVVGNALRLYRG